MTTYEDNVKCTIKFTIHRSYITVPFYVIEDGLQRGRLVDESSLKHAIARTFDLSHIGVNIDDHITDVFSPYLDLAERTPDAWSDVSFTVTSCDECVVTLSLPRNVCYDNDRELQQYLVDYLEATTHEDFAEASICVTQPLITSIDVH